MGNWQAISVNGQIPADQIVSEGDGPTLLANTDIVNTVWLSDDAGMYAGQQYAIPLNPQSTIVVDGKTDLYALANKNQIVVVNKVPGGMSFFQSTILGTSFLVTSAGFFFYSGSPGVGNLIAAIVSSGTTHDPFGNPVASILTVGNIQANVGFTQIFDSGSIILHDALGSPIIILNPNKEGIFIYDDTPHLLMSICAQGGTDPLLGQATATGITTYNSFSNSNINVASSVINFNSAGQASAAEIGEATLQSGVDSLQLASPRIVGSDSVASLYLTRQPTGTLAIVAVSGATLQILTPTNNQPTPSSGHQLYTNVDTQALSMTDSHGLDASLSFALSPTFPGTVVTQAVLSNLASVVIPAADFGQPSCWELECWGNWTQATGTAVTMQFGAFFAGSNLANQIIGTTGFNAGGTGRFYAKVRAWIITKGSSGTFQTSIWATMTPNANPNNTVVITDDDSGTITTVDLTVSRTLAIRFAWGSVTGSPAITNRRQILKRIC